MSGYGISTTVSGEFADVVEQTRQALAAEGFGVLTEIDVAATMKAKLDVDLAPYLILGACNPPLAHEALGIEPSLGLLLPCNVVVREVDGSVVVEAIDPDAMVGATGNPDLHHIATEAGARLTRAIDSINDALSGANTSRGQS